MKNIPRIKNILMEQIELLHQGTAAAAKMGTEEVLSISSLLGEHVKAYLSACHLENSEGESKNAKLAYKSDEWDRLKSCYFKDFTEGERVHTMVIPVKSAIQNASPVKGGEPHDRSNGEEQRPD